MRLDGSPVSGINRTIYHMLKGEIFVSPRFLLFSALEHSKVQLTSLYTLQKTKSHTKVIRNFILPNQLQSLTIILQPLMYVTAGQCRLQFSLLVSF